jgi:uncharacterized protein (TIGR00304 family)
MDYLLLIGIAFVFVGIALIFLSLAVHAKGKTEVGGVVLIGPFPIVFGTSKDMVIFVLLISVIAVLVLILLSKVYGMI